MGDAERRPLVCLVGPTAGGKTSLALDVAEHADFPVEIINLDSRQLYRGLELGTGKPTAEERARVRHHVLDEIDPDETYDAGRYRKRVEDLLPDIWSRGVVPFVVGGAGFYLRALREGFHVLESSPEQLDELRSQWRQFNGAQLWERLREIDPERASKLHPNDRVRVERSLELYALTGRPASELAREFQPVPVHGCEVCTVVLSPVRGELHRRIKQRAQTWLEGDWPEEVRKLRARWPEDAPGLRVLGYPQVADLIDGRVSTEECLRQILVATRRYAKQQDTWFRKEDARARGDRAAVEASLRQLLAVAHTSTGPS